MYIDKYIPRMFAIEHSIAPLHCAPVALLDMSKEARATRKLWHEVPIDDNNEPATIRIPKFITIPAETESSVVVVNYKVVFGK